MLDALVRRLPLALHVCPSARCRVNMLDGRFNLRIRAVIFNQLPGYRVWSLPEATVTMTSRCRVSAENTHHPLWLCSLCCAANSATSVLRAEMKRHTQESTYRWHTILLPGQKNRSKINKKYGLLYQNIKRISHHNRASSTSKLKQTRVSYLRRPWHRRRFPTRGW